MSELITRFRQDTSGATAIEYGLIIAFLSAAILSTYGLLSARLSAKFTSVSAALN